MFHRSETIFQQLLMKDDFLLTPRCPAVVKSYMAKRLPLLVFCSDEAVVNFDLNAYNTSAQVISALQALPQQPGAGSFLDRAYDCVSATLVNQCNERPLALCVVLTFADNAFSDLTRTDLFKSASTKA